MSRLTELPPELLEKVFVGLMDLVGWPEVHLARAVCRTVASVVNQQLLTMTPYEVFETRLFKFLNANLEPLLVSHAKKAIGFGPTTGFVNHIAEELLTIVPAKNMMDEIRHQYIQDLCRALVRTKVKFTDSCHPITTEAYLPRWYMSISDRRFYPGSEKAKLDTLLAAAAAVGS
ncbi:hypothetical protein HBI42_151160 [Parastagonospora nodorum]|nr:hypothetical protein HBI43_157570 [Parastagonospora nodorum]KAH6251563.1 hypothetical protein HBI42_151160 [Parastagonospora nodorum]